MARPLTIKQLLLLIAGGAVSAVLSVVLFSLWAVYDTPLLKFGFSIGLHAPAVAWISMSLFALSCAIVFTLLLRLFFRGNFLAAAAVFIVDAPWRHQGGAASFNPYR
jgi:hypothetical protein